MDQRRPTLWISVGNCWFFSRFTKINRIPTFIWVMLKNPLKKIVHFSNVCQITKNCIIFKKLTIFGILRFLPIWIQSRQFWAILSDFCKKMDLNFFKFSKIAAEMSKIADFEFFHDKFRLARIWEFQNWSIFKKNNAIFGDLTHLKMNNFFQCIFIA